MPSTVKVREPELKVARELTLSKPTDGSQAAVPAAEEVANGLERVKIAENTAENGQSNGTSPHVENGKESNGSGISDQENQRPTESAPKKERGKVSATTRDVVDCEF